jgi:hypothetical protein
MIDNLLHIKLFKPKKILGITCDILADESYVWRYCILQQTKNSVTVIKSNTIKELSELKKEKLSLVPVYLSIEGKGVIHKKVKSDSENPSIYQVIPNALPDDFCISEIPSDNNLAFVSIVRRDVVDTILSQFIELGLHVLQVRVGSFHLAFLQEWFSGMPEKLAAGNMMYTFDNNSHKLKDFTKTDQPVNNGYAVAGENISSEYISSFTNALSFFFVSNEPVYQAIEKNKVEFLAHRLFTIGGWGLLVFAFAMLLTNYLFYMQYSDKANKLEKFVADNGQNLVIVEKLKDELKRKEQFLTQSGFAEKSNFSYYTDLLASTIPSEVQLLELNVNPLKSKIKKEKAIELRKGIIAIKGQTLNSIILNDWIKNLEEFKWIRKISVVQYMKEQTNNYGEFILDIEMR